MYFFLKKIVELRQFEPYTLDVFFFFEQLWKKIFFHNQFILKLQLEIELEWDIHINNFWMVAQPRILSKLR